MRKIKPPAPLLNMFLNGIVFIVIGLIGLFIPGLLKLVVSFLHILLDAIFLFATLSIDHPFGWYLFLIGGVMLDILAMGAYYEYKKERTKKRKTTRTKTARRIR